MASQIEQTFVTAEQLIDAVESGELEEHDGVGEKTAKKIYEWSENAEEREEKVNKTVFKKQSERSATISFYNSWVDALGIEVNDNN